MHTMTRISRGIRWSIQVAVLATLISLPVMGLQAEDEKQKFKVGFNEECNWPCIWPPECCAA
jgi:hypothetical protein